MRYYLLYDRFHLIDLDGEDNIMVAFEIILLRSFLETGCRRLDTCVEYIGETQ